MAREYEAPVGEIETALAEIWAEVLKLERVGRHDNFFELGGHSLLAMKVVSRLRQELGAEVTVTELFAYPALSELARTIERARSALPPITKTSRMSRWRCRLRSSGCGSWRRWKGPARPITFPRIATEAARLTGALRRALDRLVARHEALRTTFVAGGGQPVKHIAAEEIGFCLQEHDLRKHGDAEGELEAADGGRSVGGVRSGSRAADARATGPTGGGHRACAAGDDASHRVGRLVDERADRGVERALHGF